MRPVSNFLIMQLSNSRLKFIFGKRQKDGNNVEKGGEIWYNYSR